MPLARRGVLSLRRPGRIAAGKAQWEEPDARLSDRERQDHRRQPGCPTTRRRCTTSPRGTAAATCRAAATSASLEGEAPDVTLIALIEFPSFEAAEAFANDPDYAPHGRARQAGSVSDFYVIDDSDLAGGIPYLPKGGA